MDKVGFITQMMEKFTMPKTEKMKKLKARMVVQVKQLSEKQQKQKYPFQEGEQLLYLGSVKNMPGHGIVANRDGEVMWPFPNDIFEPLTSFILD